MISMSELDDGRDDSAEVFKSSSDQDPEKYNNQLETTGELKLDNNGLPLVPQPSRFKDDPLVSTLKFPTNPL